MAVEWSGRLEVLAQRPLLVVDGAHNRESARRLLDALREAFDFERLWLVLGVTEGKDLPGLLETLAPSTAGIVATRATHGRALDPREIARVAGGNEVRVVADVGQALRLAQDRAVPGDLVCVTGSLFLVGEAIQAAHALGLVQR
jgi:dihydrofolate synthase/folylpolyglutamate synthase